MRQLVQQWKESGLTQKVFCEKIGIKRTTFANWVKRSKETPRANFVAITPSIKPVAESIEVIYPNGVRLKTSAIDIPVLSKLIQLY